MSPLNPLFDPASDNASIAPETQKLLNRPLQGDGFDVNDQAFLDLLMSKIADKSIQLYAPSSLLNPSVYDTLSQELKGKADQNAMVMLIKIREIYHLMQVSREPSYQLKNLVDSLHFMKKRLEARADLFVI